MNQQLAAFAAKFCRDHPGEPVDGTYYDLPDTVVYTTSTLKLPERSRIEINTITANTPPSFEWQHEITIKDKPTGTFVHVLLRRDGSVVETYGKTILPVDENRGAEILALLEGLAYSGA